MPTAVPLIIYSNYIHVLIPLHTVTVMKLPNGTTAYMYMPEV